MYQRTDVLAPISVRTIITVYHTLLTRDYQKEDVHDFPELLYVEKGPLLVLVNGQEHRLESGQAILYAPMARHRFAEPSNATIHIVSFEAQGASLSGCSNQVLDLTRRQRWLLDRVISDGMELFDRRWIPEGYKGVAPHPGASSFDLQQLRTQLELLLVDLLLSGSPTEQSGTASNRENYKREQFDRLTDYLKDHLGENLTLDGISQRFGMSPSALRRLCHEQCGCAPMAYFTSLKIVRAKRLIRETSMSFTQIAEELGFYTGQHFSKRFKKEAGLTPSQYARSIQQGSGLPEEDEQGRQA